MNTSHFAGCLGSWCSSNSTTTANGYRGSIWCMAQQLPRQHNSCQWDLYKIQQTELFQLVQLTLRFILMSQQSHNYCTMQLNAMHNIYTSYVYGFCHISVLLSQCIKISKQNEQETVIKAVQVKGVRSELFCLHKGVNKAVSISLCLQAEKTGGKGQFEVKLHW